MSRVVGQTVGQHACPKEYLFNRNTLGGEPWQPVGESNPSYQVENLVS